MAVVSLAEAGGEAGGHFVVAEDRGKLVKPPIVGGQVHREGTAANIVSLGLVETDHDKE
jgi:hypothetical protein